VEIGKSAAKLIFFFSQHKEAVHSEDVATQETKRFALARGELVARILAARMDLASSRIIDVGCGFGGVSLALARCGAQVTAVDANPARIRKLQEWAAEFDLSNIEAFVNTCENLSAQERRYDAAILLDVIEHLSAPESALQRISRFLKRGGRLYLSTPNRCSLLNLPADPHYGLPFISMCRRENVRRIVGEILHKRHASKIDYPELFSLTRLRKALRAASFVWQFVNREAIAFALQHPESVWNRSWHLAIVRWLRKLGNAERLSGKLTNDDQGSFNKWINPTWFILAVRK